MYSRESSELKIEILIKELISAIKELATVSTVDKASESDLNTLKKVNYKSVENNSNTKIKLTDKETKVYLKHMNQSSTTLWKSIYGKVSDLKLKWEEARTEAKRVAFGSIDAHRITTQNFAAKARSANELHIFDGPSRILAIKSLV